MMLCCYTLMPFYSYAIMVCYASPNTFSVLLHLTLSFKYLWLSEYACVFLLRPGPLSGFLTSVSDDSTNDMNFHWSLGFVPNISHVCVLLGVSWAAETKTWSCKFSDSHHWKHFLLPLCSITLSQWEYDWKESDTKWPWMSKFLYFGFFPLSFFCLQM